MAYAHFSAPAPEKIHEGRVEKLSIVPKKETACAKAGRFEGMPRARKRARGKGRGSATAAAAEEQQDDEDDPDPVVVVEYVAQTVVHSEPPEI
jgi:hypothetical protein